MSKAMPSTLPLSGTPDVSQRHKPDRQSEPQRRAAPKATASGRPPSLLNSDFTIKRIVGYYFSENSFVAVCYDTKNKMHYIKPFDKGNDIVMINTSVEVASFRGLRYIQVPDPITVEDYDENYGLWRRIGLWLKL